MKRRAAPSVGAKEQIMAEIFTDWEPAEEPEDEMER